MQKGLPFPGGLGDAVPVCLLQAEGLGIKIGIIPEAGHNLGVILQDRVRVLEVRCQTAVLGLDRPAVLGLGDLAVVLADHRLNGNGHAGTRRGPRPDGRSWAPRGPRAVHGRCRGPRTPGPRRNLPSSQ